MSKTSKPSSTNSPGRRRLQDCKVCGEALIAAFQSSPYREIDIEPRRERLPVRAAMCDRPFNPARRTKLKL
jgi:hypothetical protein